MLRGIIKQARTASTHPVTLTPVASRSDSFCGGIRFASFTRPKPPRHQTSPSNNAKNSQKNTQKSSPITQGPKPNPAYPQRSSRRVQPAEPPARPRDGKIEHTHVRLVDPDTGALGPLTTLSEVIRIAHNRVEPDCPEQPETSDDDKKVKWWKKRKYSVELVSSEPTPIVRLIDLGEEYRNNRDVSKKKKESAVKEKEVQMTWSVAEGDLEHKMKKIREALEEGERVVIGFTRKKGQPYPKPEDMAAKLQETAETLADVGVEWKERAILPNHTGFIYIKKP